MNRAHNCEIHRCLRRSVDFRTPEGARKDEQSSLAVEHISSVPTRRLSRVPEEFYAYLERAIERMTPFQPFRSPDAEEFFRTALQAFGFKTPAPRRSREDLLAAMGREG